MIKGTTTTVRVFSSPKKNKKEISFEMGLCHQLGNWKISDCWSLIFALDICNLMLHLLEHTSCDQFYELMVGLFKFQIEQFMWKFNKIAVCVCNLLLIPLPSTSITKSFRKRIVINF